MCRLMGRNAELTAALVLLCAWLPVDSSDRLAGELFECGSVPAKTISASLVMDGFCDCCNGADELPPSGTVSLVVCPNTCDNDVQHVVETLRAFEIAHDVGAERATTLWNAQKQQVTKIRRVFFNNIQSAAEAAQLLNNRYEEVRQRVVNRGGKATTAEYHAMNKFHEQLLENEASVQAAHVQGNAKYGKNDRWILAIGQCASSAPISEKSSKGGSTTSIPKSYVYTVCFGANVTQTEFLPDEWDRKDRLSKGMAIETVTDVSGEIHLRNRTYGRRQMLGRWGGYLSMEDFDIHLWGSRTRFDESDDPIPSVALRPRGTELGQAIMFYVGNDQCRSESITTGRKVYVFHLCPNTSVEQLRIFEGAQSASSARRFGQFNWNSPSTSDDGAGWMGSVVNVHEDGLCTYKIYVTSITACSKSLARASRERRQELELNSTS